MALCHLHTWRPIPPLPLKTVTKPVARPVLWMRTPCLAWNTKTRRTKANLSFLWGSGDRTSVHAPPCSKPGLSVGTPAGFLPLCAPCTAPADKHGVLRKPHQASCHLHPALHPSWQLASGPCFSPLLPMGGDPCCAALSRLWELWLGESPCFSQALQGKLRQPVTVLLLHSDLPFLASTPWHSHYADALW